jgi:hypothetical protein
MVSDQVQCAVCGQSVRLVSRSWLPTRGLGFSANADFVDHNSGLIIHVDSPAHYATWHPGYRIRTDKDRKLDAWCAENGWLFLRLTDTDTQNRPNMCQGLIRLLVQGRIVPLIGEANGAS